MKFFVTGAGGMLAADLIPLLRQKGEVSEGDLPDFDIADSVGVAERLRKLDPDVIINCAAYTAVDRAEEERDLAFQVNAGGAENLALAAAEIKAKLVHVSTDFIFDGTKGVPYGEDDAPNPLSVYGQSKLEGERLVRQTLDDHLIVRTSWLYGKKGHNFVETIRRLASERESLGIVFDQVGTPTYTVDLAEAIVRLIEQKATGVYHFANEGVCSWYDFAYEIIGTIMARGDNLKLKTLKPILTQEYPTPAVRPNYSVLDKKKYKGITLQRIPHWTDALKRYMTQEVEGKNDRKKYEAF